MRAVIIDATLHCIISEVCQEPCGAARCRAELSETLKAINWKGACAIAAHQHRLPAEQGEELILKTIAQ